MQTEQSVRLGYWMDWNDPELLREMADKLVEDPTQVMTVLVLTARLLIRLSSW